MNLKSILGVIRYAITTAILAEAVLAGSPSGIPDDWPQWRGPEANGVAPGSNPPVTWSEDSNVKWKIEIPGSGHASPIIANELIFVQTAIQTDRAIENPQAQQEGDRRSWMNPIKPSHVLRFTILAIDRNTGNVVWQKNAREQAPHEGTHQHGSWASTSPITDGEHVYAYFGSWGIYAYDMKGNLKWEKDLGKQEIKLAFGEGGAPALYGDKLIINWDHEGQSFIVALDKKNGKEIWKVDRDEQTSWASPLVVESDAGVQVITSATGKIRSYDVDTGTLIWESSGMTGNVIPTPVATDDMVFVMSGFRGNALQAIRLSAAEGDITGSDAIVWELDRDTPYTPSPLLYDHMLYFLKTNDNILACFDARTGEEYFSRKRLEGMNVIYASPVGANDRIYIAGREGTVAVLKHGREFEVLATNHLDDGFTASPAIAGDELFLRGHRWLYCIAEN